eukprot:281746-Lingulodinium_polyedra.AAC.1
MGGGMAARPGDLASGGLAGRCAAAAASARGCSGGGRRAAHYGDPFDYQGGYGDLDDLDLDPGGSAAVEGGFPAGWRRGRRARACADS